MPGYRFFGPADMAQDEIWTYTEKEWGQAQAETYIRGLHTHLQRLADKEAFWFPLPAALVVPQDLPLAVYFGVYEKHVIFFRELANGDIGIMALLHERMNLPVRLAEDLRKIQERMKQENNKG